MTRGPDPSAAHIPSASVARLAVYLHVLRALSENGVVVTSSGQLATAAGVNPAILRKDLSHVGANGVRGVGYDVARLIARISRALRTSDTHNVALAGAGLLGRALVAHTGFGRGFRVVAMFDTDPAVVGTGFRSDTVDITVAPMTELAHQCAEREVDVAVIATPDTIAQTTCDAFVRAGVRQILNVSTVTLRTPPSVHVRPVDLALELQVLSFNASQDVDPAEIPSPDATASRIDSRDDCGEKVTV